MSKSRYIRWFKQYTPRPRRGAKLPGATTVSVDKTSDEEGKWVRCSNCGFPIDTTKVDNGAQEMGNDAVQVTDFDYSEVSIHLRGSNPGNQVSRPDLQDGDFNTPSMDIVGGIGTVIQLGADGTADSFTYTPRQIVITSGCPFCGSDVI